jgi:GNAT superfamily N-acetyltransferase
MEIRAARLEDAPAMAGLSSQLGYPVSPTALAERLARILDRSDELVLVAYQPDGTVIGWVHGAEQRFLEADRRCELLGLVVDRGSRRHGIGRQLVSAVEQWARRRGLGEISVRSNIVRAESHPFYERLGYQRTKTQHVYRKPLSPLLP